MNRAKLLEVLDEQIRRAYVEVEKAEAARQALIDLFNIIQDKERKEQL